MTGFNLYNITPRFNGIPVQTSTNAPAVWEERQWSMGTANIGISFTPAPVDGTPFQDYVTQTNQSPTINSSNIFNFIGSQFPANLFNVIQQQVTGPVVAASQSGQNLSERQYLLNLQAINYLSQFLPYQSVEDVPNQPPFSDNLNNTMSSTLTAGVAAITPPNMNPTPIITALGSGACQNCHHGSNFLPIATSSAGGPLLFRSSFFLQIDENGNPSTYLQEALKARFDILQKILTQSGTASVNNYAAVHSGTVSATNSSAVHSGTVNATNSTALSSGPAIYSEKEISLYKNLVVSETNRLHEMYNPPTEPLRRAQESLAKRDALLKWKQQTGRFVPTH